MKEKLQSILLYEIPISHAMGIEVKVATSQEVRLSAPLVNNINHKCTAFGGSLYSVSVLSGWGLVYCILAEHGLQGHIVIQESNIQYLKPVDGELRAVCRMEKEEAVARFVKVFKRKGRARLVLRCEVVHGGEPAVLFEGAFVVHV